MLSAGFRDLSMKILPSDCLGSNSGRQFSEAPQPETFNPRNRNIGALMIRTGFWGILYDNYNKEQYW